VSEDQQMLDDAAATGMTSRLPSQADADRHADEASNAGG